MANLDVEDGGVDEVLEAGEEGEEGVDGPEHGAGGLDHELEGLEG